MQKQHVKTVRIEKSKIEQIEHRRIEYIKHKIET